MMQVATKDDHEIFMPLMLVVYNILTQISVNVKLAMSIMLEIDVFGALTSIEKDTLKFLRIESSFFPKFYNACKCFQSFDLVGKT